MQEDLIDQPKWLQEYMDRAIDAALEKGGLLEVTQDCRGSENESQPGQQANAGTDFEAGESVSGTGQQSES
jgi:hypothetical protein